MIYIKHLLWIITLCCPLIANAQCEKWIDSLLKDYHSSRNSDMAICKVWPADESKTIVVLPLPHGSGEDDTYDLDVLLIDSQSGKLITHNWQPDALESDAIRLEGVEIDTARYQLNPQSRAFGVRINYQGSSRVNPYYEQLMNLYIMQDKTLNRVVNQLVMYRSGGEWDTNCDGQFNARSRTISLSQHTTKNYADLILSEKSQDTLSKSHGEDTDCIEETIDLPKKTFTLQYNGVEYPLLSLQK